MIEDGSSGGSHGTGERPVLHAVWRWDGVGLEIAIAELPGVLILVPTLADAALATRKRLARDVYDHGCILRADKYRWLYWSYTLFLVGLVVTFGSLLLKLFLMVKADGVFGSIPALP